MISVCLATFNGRAYVEEQVRSVLAQLSPEDELVVADDGSTDDTVAIIEAMHDSRIRWAAKGGGVGVVRNFERAVAAARGSLVFLCDQDDVWLPNKVDVLVDALRSADLVVSDCRVTDSELNTIHESFFLLRGSGPGVLKNIWRNSYLGCCIAFRRDILKAALPFPSAVPMHDMWVGLIADAMYKVGFVETPTLLYRRHGGNASPTAETSHLGFARRLRYRAVLVWALCLRVLVRRLSGRNQDGGSPPVA